ncbi:MAG TPA: hypothetical protein VH501_09990, partial [Solirubrobacterales bacterium]
MEASESRSSGATSPRRRRKTVYALIVVASVLAFIAAFAIWANRQLLETDTWTNTSSELLENPEIRTQVADYMVDTLYANVDVQGELQSALPPRLQPLAGPAAAGIHQLAIRLANEALERPRIQQLWEDANRTAQSTLLRVVEHGGSEPVTLDIGTIVDELGQELGINAAERLPPNVAQIKVVSNDDLVKVNDLLNLLKTLAWVVTVLALALFALAIYLAEGWRRVALRSVGFALIIVGILVLVVRTVAGNAIIDHLATTESVRPAVRATWEIGTSLLNAQGGAVIFYGLFIVIGAWLAGPMGLASRARRAITPILENRVVAYSALGLILLLLFLWSPTPGFSRLPTALLLIVLSIVGLEFLRRQA